jgi:hypothetical protein
MLPACLVDDPPPLIAPHQTEPRLNYTTALPVLDQVIVANSGETINFTVEIKSEDAGQPLTGILLLDYSGDGSIPDFLWGVPFVPPSTLDDPEPRSLKLPWTVRDPLAPGCHRITLRVTHVNNINPDHPVEAIDKKDLAEAFWFANINVSPESANQLVDCPQASNRGLAK